LKKGQSNKSSTFGIFGSFVLVSSKRKVIKGGIKAQRLTFLGEGKKKPSNIDS
jgi:hypothetical protein